MSARGSAARAATLGLLLVASLALLAGCERKTTAKAVDARPVRTVTAEKSGASETVVLTGQISAENEASLAFRIGGRIIERMVDVGARVEPDQVLARLDPQNELNALRSAKAALSAAEGRVIETTNAFERQRTLLPQGFTTQALFDQAQQALRTAQSQLDKAEARSAGRQGSCQLYRTAGQALQARSRRGQPRQGKSCSRARPCSRWLGRTDATRCSTCRPRLIRSAPAEPNVAISLIDDPAVTAQGRVRQVDPQADPITRTFRVRVGLINPPPAMFLGATVTGEWISKRLSASRSRRAP